MPATCAGQCNPYIGDPPRAWIRVTLYAIDGSQRELALLADTGNPCPIIIAPDLFRVFVLEELDDVESNFGPMLGGWLQVAVPETKFLAAD